MIPLHMVEVLRLFSSSRFYDSPKIQHILCSIVQNFEGFLNGKNEGGDKWESLFTIPLLIRSLVNDFSSIFFPSSLATASHSCGSISYNRWSGNGPPLNEIKTLRKFWECKPAPCVFPHIDVYCFPHDKFEAVDVAFIFYDKDGGCECCLYQLKEGKKIPKAFHFDREGVTIQKFMVRGSAKPEKRNGWTDVGSEETDRFFGVSGSEWTPEKWRNFRDSDKGKDKDEGKDEDEDEDEDADEDKDGELHPVKSVDNGEEGSESGSGC